MKYIFVFVISLFFFVLTYISAPEEFTLVDLAAIVVLTVFFLTLGCFIASRFVSYKIVQNLILSGLIIVNLINLHLALNTDFILLSRYAQLLFLLLFMFIFTTLLNMFDSDLKFGYRALISLLPLVLLITLSLQTKGYNLDLVNRTIQQADKNIKPVDFKIKPNVYFISFDALIPAVILKKHLDLESTAYHLVLDQDFRQFNNFFADHVPTKPSLNSLLILDIGYFNEMEAKYSHLFYPGLVASPLLDIFKYNGYETTTLFNDLYFGQSKGAYVDHYQVNITTHSACTYISPSGLRIFTLMGYCLLVQSGLLTDVLSMFPEHSNKKPQTDIDFLIDNMRSGLQRSSPQFLLAYIYSPGHTEIDFDKEKPGAIEEYQQFYSQKSERMDEYLNKIVTFITEEDPEAIVYIFGDHGPFLSRQDNIEQDDTFFIQDRYGVYGGIYPKNRCGEYFDQFYDTRVYMTIAQGAHVILKCLSGGENAFITEKYYPLPVSTPSHQYRYEDYLYE